VARIERQSLGAGVVERAAALGVSTIDTSLGGGLALGALHDIAAADVGAGLGLAAALAARIVAEAQARAAGTTVLWCLPLAGLYETGNLHAPGFAGIGLDPSRFLVARGRRDVDILWAMEEGLRVPALAAVIGDVRTLDLVHSQRLALAARRSGVAALIVRPGLGGAMAAMAEPSAAATRWRVRTAPAAAVDRPGPRGLAWDLELVRARGGGGGRWRVAWQDDRFAVLDRRDQQPSAHEVSHDPDRFGLAPVLRHRPPTPCGRGEAGPIRRAG
jgi:protein ImuA